MLARPAPAPGPATARRTAMSSQWGFETRQIHAGATPDPTTGARAVPIYQTTSYTFHYTLPKLGIEVTFVDDPDDLDAWRRSIRPTTKGFFAETLGNPKGDVLDFEGVSAVAHAEGIPLVVDNTVATPYLCQPLSHGADVVVHSATKFIGGHGTSIGGIIVDGGRFDYEGSGKFPGFTEPDPSYHGLVFGQLPEPLFPARYVLKARLQYLRDLGAA